MLTSGPAKIAACLALALCAMWAWAYLDSDSNVREPTGIEFYK